jgi:hypothetical protein
VFAVGGAAEEIQRPRARCKITGQMRRQEKWWLALDTLDEIMGAEAAGGWGLPGRPVVIGAGYGEITGFRLDLQALGLRYVIAVKGVTRVCPVGAVPESLSHAGHGRPPMPRCRG